jgi:hypothetical protein
VVTSRRVAARRGRTSDAAALAGKVAEKQTFLKIFKQ